MVGLTNIAFWSKNPKPPKSQTLNPACPNSQSEGQLRGYFGETFLSSSCCFLFFSRLFLALTVAVRMFLHIRLFLVLDPAWRRRRRRRRRGRWEEEEGGGRGCGEGDRGGREEDEDEDHSQPFHSFGLSKSWHCRRHGSFAFNCPSSPPSPHHQLMVLTSPCHHDSDRRRHDHDHDMDHDDAHHVNISVTITNCDSTSVAPHHHHCHRPLVGNAMPCLLISKCLFDEQVPHSGEGFRVIGSKV